MAHFISGGTDDPRTATKYAASNYELKLAKPLAATPGACADFSCVITRRERDRDGDLLEPSGAEVDEKMPLLWQHKPDQPIGKLVKILKQNRDVLEGHFAIADTELGRDAAKLAEFGALRISHGFRVLEASPWKDGSPGWHCTKIAVVETSLVAIPALPSAQLQQIQVHAKSFSPEGRKWVESLQQQSDFDRRFAASCAGKSSWELSMDDLYRRNGFQTPAERNTIVLSPAPAPAPASNPGVDQQALVKAMHDYQGLLVHVFQEFRNARESLGKKS